jgi:NADH:ubiquinone oxidoreductase subunit E
MTAGTISPGNPLSVNLSEGSHTVKICAGTVCEQANVHIGYAIRTTVDFEDALRTDALQGTMSVSIGDYPATLPVFIDDAQAGTVSQGKTLNQTISTGIHTVKICVGDTCFNRTVEIQPSDQTTLDFEEQLENHLLKGPLRVSIGGYNAELPVFLDNAHVGVVSMGNPLDLVANVGNHSIRVCSGNVCEDEEVQIKFAKQSVVDFGEQLEKDAKFPAPAVRITNSTTSGSTMTVDVEFVNPDTIDHSFTATVSCVYTFTDSYNIRESSSAQTMIIRTVEAGNTATQQVTLGLYDGSNVIAGPPVLVDVTIK